MEEQNRISLREPRDTGSSEALDPEDYGRSERLVPVPVWIVVVITTAVRLGSYLRLSPRVYGDNSVVAFRTANVFTRHSPLLGQGTSASVYGLKRTTNQIGPSLYWAWRPFTAVFGPDVGMYIGAGALSALAIVGCCAAASDVLGRRAGYAATILALLVAGFGMTGFTISPLNPWAATLPLFLTMITAWAMACGHVRWAPVALLAGSFAVQAHISTALPAFTAVAFGVVVSATRHQRAFDRRLLWVSGLTLAAVWWPTVLDQFFGSGNLLRALTPGQFPTRGLRGALEVFGGLAALPPLVVQPYFLRNTNMRSPGSLTVLLPALALYWGYRCWSGFAPALRILVVLASLEVVAAILTGTQLPAGAIEYYHEVWMRPVAALCALPVAIVAGQALARQSRSLRYALGVLLLPVLLLVGFPVTKAPSASNAVAALSAGRNGQGVARGSLVVLRGSLATTEVWNGFIYALQQQGRDPRVIATLGPYFGQHAASPQGRSSQVVAVVNPDGFEPPPEAKRIARFDPGPAAAARRKLLLARISEFVRTGGALSLNDSGQRDLSTVIDGRLLSACLATLRTNPRALAELPPAALGDLFVNSMVAEPALPDDLAVDLEILSNDIAAEVWAMPMTAQRDPASLMITRDTCP